MSDPHILVTASRIGRRRVGSSLRMISLHPIGWVGCERLSHAVWRCSALRRDLCSRDSVKTSRLLMEISSETAYRYVDGVMLWAPSRFQRDGASGWWALTSEFIPQVASASGAG